MPGTTQDLLLDSAARFCHSVEYVEHFLQLMLQRFLQAEATESVAIAEAIESVADA